MLADSEAEPASPGEPEEVRTLDPELIENGYRIRDAERHRKRRRVVRLVAAAVAAVIDIDVAELVGWNPLGDRRSPHDVDRLPEPSVENERGPLAALVLEVHGASVQRVGDSFRGLGQRRAPDYRRLDTSPERRRSWP